jgi:hypothetical protein
MLAIMYRVLRNSRIPLFSSQKEQPGRYDVAAFVLLTIRQYEGKKEF